MVKDHLLDKYSENELLSENFRVYTTLDPACSAPRPAPSDAGMKIRGPAPGKKITTSGRRDQAKKGNSEAPIPQAQSRWSRWTAHRGIKAVIWWARLRQSAGIIGVAHVGSQDRCSNFCL